MDKLSKFRKNMRMEQAVCRNCVMPQRHRNTMAMALNGAAQMGAHAAKRVSNGTPVEKRDVSQVGNFYKTKPYRYRF